MNKKLVNFEKIKNKKQDAEAKKLYTLGDYYDYKIAIADYMSKVSNLYNKTRNVKYLNELNNRLIDFYNAVFNICDKMCQLIQDDNHSVESGLVYFLPKIEELHSAIINLKRVKKYDMTFDQLEKLRNREKCYKNCFSIDDYIMQRNELDQYLCDITELSKNEEAQAFCMSEQYNIIDNCYEIFNNILEQFIKQAENQDFTNEASVYLMMVEFEKIVKKLPNPDNYSEEIDDKKVKKLKKD